MTKNNIKVYDNLVPLEIRDAIYQQASNSIYRLGWKDFSSGEHVTDPNLYSDWSLDDLQKTKILEFIHP